MTDPGTGNPVTTPAYPMVATVATAGPLWKVANRTGRALHNWDDHRHADGEDGGSGNRQLEDRSGQQRQQHLAKANCSRHADDANVPDLRRCSISWTMRATGGRAGHDRSRAPRE